MADEDRRSGGCFNYVKPHNVMVCPDPIDSERILQNRRSFNNNNNKMPETRIAGFVQMVCVPFPAWSSGIPTYQEYAAAMPGVPLMRDASGAYYTIDAHGNYAIVPFSADSKLPTSPSMSCNGSFDSGKETSGKPGPGGDARSKSDEPNDPAPNFFDRSFVGSSYGATFMRRSFPSMSRTRRNTATYKTMMCTMFSNNGSCTYGLRCQYAHGKEDLRVVAPHPKFKTQMCNKYYSAAGCQYGDKCHFIHPNSTSESS